MLDVLEFMYEILPPWLATAIAGLIGLVAGIGGAAWHSHEQAQLAACNSAAGRFTQAFSGAAQADCGASSLLSKVALAMEVIGFVVLGVFTIVFCVLAAKGKLLKIEGI